MNTAVTSYSMNSAGAKAAGVSSIINEKGRYKGRFTRAEQVVSAKGTQGIEFDFKSDEGATAQYLTIWTINKDGVELYGRKVVDAIMACIGVRTMSISRARTKKWNSQEQAEEVVDANCFADLMDKPVGLLLTREEYEANDGSRKWKNNLVLPFEYSTGRTAKERLDGAHTAEAIDKIVPLLKDRPLPANHRSTNGGAQRQAPTGGGSSGQSRQANGFDDMDDDIPF